MSERPRIRPGQASPDWVAGAQRESREGDGHGQQGQDGDAQLRVHLRGQHADHGVPQSQVTTAGLAGETWKRIPASRLLGIPAGYEASSEGNVRSPRQVLSQWPDKDGYPMVKVGGKPRRVAILVQLAWAGLPQVMHLDDDRENSRPGNLAWGSKVVNEQMKRKTERKKAGSEGASLRSGLGHLGQRDLG